MAVLTQFRGELELFERSLLGPDAVRYLWINAHSAVGVIFTAEELETLLGHIGSSPAWDWIRVRKEFDNELWAQACGRASDGVIVEINGPHLVARCGAPRGPRVDVGTPTWPYRAAAGERHTVAEAAHLQLGWLDSRHLSTSFEKRAADDSVKREG